MFNTTIKDNIVGFSSFNTARYTEVIEATMLVEDLSTFPAGDQTVIGNKGMFLSGGQRQRVSLARALYHDAKILILDGHFSGLDGSTQDKVCQSVLGPNGLLLLRRRGTTALVCTHAMQILAVADHVLALSSDGTINEQGRVSGIIQDSRRAECIGLTGTLDIGVPTAKENIEPDDMVVQEVKAPTTPESTLHPTVQSNVG